MLTTVIHIIYFSLYSASDVWMDMRKKPEYGIPANTEQPVPVVLEEHSSGELTEDQTGDLHRGHHTQLVQVMAI